MQNKKRITIKDQADLSKAMEVGGTLLGDCFILEPGTYDIWYSTYMINKTNVSSGDHIYFDNSIWKIYGIDVVTDSYLIQNTKSKEHFKLDTDIVREGVAFKVPEGAKPDTAKMLYGK